MRLIYIWWDKSHHFKKLNNFLIKKGKEIFLCILFILTLEIPLN